MKRIGTIVHGHIVGFHVDKPHQRIGDLSAQTGHRDARWQKIAKNLIGIFTQLAVIILTIVAQSIRMNMAGNFSLSELLMIAMSMISIASLSSSICLPFIFKMGVEKGRTAYYVMIGIVCAGAASASMLFGEQAAAQINLPIAIIAGVSVAIYAVSWYLSIRFYKKRELYESAPKKARTKSFSPFVLKEHFGMAPDTRNNFLSLHVYSSKNPANRWVGLRDFHYFCANY